MKIATFLTKINKNGYKSDKIHLNQTANEQNVITLRLKCYAERYQDAHI